MNTLKSRFPIYSRLLGLYPANYRKHYENEILQTAADMLDGAPTAFSKLGIWMLLCIDLPVNVTRQQLLHTGGYMNTQVPGYVKRNGLISFALLIPFLLALTANGLDKVIKNRTLNNSWLWSHEALRIWIIWLPTLALLIAAISFLNFVFKDSTKTSWLNRIVDIKRIWPVAVPLAGALFIMSVIVFHDSAHCWVHSPMFTAKHLNQVWQCSNQERAFTNWPTIKRAYF
jgi:hypothetical protein